MLLLLLLPLLPSSPSTKRVVPVASETVYMALQLSSRSSRKTYAVLTWSTGTQLLCGQKVVKVSTCYASCFCSPALASLGQPLSTSTLSPSMQRSAVKPKAGATLLGAVVRYWFGIRPIGFVTASTSYTSCFRFTALSSSPLLLLFCFSLRLPPRCTPLGPPLFGRRACRRQWDILKAVKIPMFVDI